MEPLARTCAHLHPLALMCMGLHGLRGISTLVGMTDPPLDESLLSFLEPQISRHRDWLTRFPVAERKWVKMYKVAQESAVVEACSRDLLESRAGAVEPAEGETGSGPDFRVAGDNGEFFVEATALTRAKVEAETKILDYPEPHHRGCHGQLTRAIQEKARTKASQLGGASIPDCSWWAPCTAGPTSCWTAWAWK